MFSEIRLNSQVSALVVRTGVSAAAILDATFIDVNTSASVVSQSVASVTHTRVASCQYDIERLIVMSLKNK